MDIVVLISGNGSNLQALIDQQPHHHYRIAAVISNKADAYGLQRAQQANIPTKVIDHRQYTDRDAFDRALQAHIDNFQPELVVLAGFMRILTDGFVRHYTGRMINIHPSLLPKYRGLHTHQRVIDAGDKEHGTTVHFVTEELDGGPIIIQAVIQVTKEDTATTLAQKVQQQEHTIYPKAVAWFSEQKLKMEHNKCLLDGELLPPQGVQIRH
ncbi:phosphoribosylglycinamide formyltransferase [Zooshikella harenae]|uniref:Phosphoribosylglycinamide formyltransferase n=1 Tax=Zooshikella harenae TaxID=2827238 RepID=A0ABS5Z8D1_9GAMM|nr:phosphoribosylglycinamide formyltransferase [Zooshikella harenae]MBU2710264.1 phosphoribosylglycinamide formyltransferase [Zooshikella harenae]